MQIEDLIGVEDIVLDLAGGSKEQALSALAATAASRLSLDAAIIVKALADRERLGSTGVGQGVAIPHARIKGLNKYFALFARLDRAVDFDAVDNKPVDLVFLLLMPEKTGNDHLAALAAISRKLRDKTMAPRLRAASRASEVFELLTRNTAAPRA